VATQIATTTQTSNSYLGGGAQRRIAFLCDGSLAVIYHDGSAWRLIQVVNPNTASPTVNSIAGYPGQSNTSAVPDMWVQNNGTAASDLWFTDTQSSLAVTHATYTAAGSTWSWGARTAVPAASTGSLWSQIVWTGTYLIEAHQDAAGGSFAIFANYTTDSTGATGWLPAEIQLGTIASTARNPRCSLYHDASLAATVIVYTQGAAQPVGIVSRILADTFTPDLANWGPETSLGVSANVTLGGQLADENALTTVVDPLTKRVHFAYGDSTQGGPRSPGYLTGVPTVDTVTPANNVIAWSSPLAIDADRTATQTSIAVDQNGTVYLYWCTEPTSTSGDVRYVTLKSPYAQASAMVALTNHLSDNNEGSHIPQQQLTAGFVPVVYGIGTTVNGTAPPWKIMLDTTGKPGTGTTPPPNPPPSSTSTYLVGTSSDKRALALGTQRRVATLCDGSLAVLEFDGSTPHLFQVTNPSATPPTVASVATFSNMGSFYALADMFVSNNGNGTSDIWIADTTGVARVTHGVYTASTRSWSWGGSFNVPGSSGNAFYANVIWTGQRLIVAHSDGTGPWGLFYNWTTDRTGATGWSSEGDAMLSSAKANVVRPAPVLVHDSGLGATVCMYMLATQIACRVLSDASAPLLANWGPEQNVAVADVEIAINTEYPYFNNHCAAIDPLTRKLHYVHCDSHGGPSPAYMLGTVSVDNTTPANNRVSWGPQLALAPASNTASSPAIGVDQSSRVYVFWATSPSSGVSDVEYTSLTAPYTSAGAPVDLTNASTNNNISPHIPRSETIQGFVPVVYLTAGTSAWGTSSPWAIVLDNSIVTVNGGFADAGTRFAIAGTSRAWQDVGARFVLTAPPSAVVDVAARFKLAPKPGRPVVFTGSSAAALAVASQRKVATLCDGSLAVLGFDGSTEHLFRVASPATAPVVSSVQAFGAQNNFYALPDMLVVNNGTATSDVWIADTTTVSSVQHGTYTAATQSWTWDTRTAVPGSTGNAFIVELIWTGTYLICAYQDGGSRAVFYNYTATKNATAGWQSGATQLSSGSSGVRPATLLMHDGALGATVCIYNIGSQVISRVLADSLSPALANWGPEVNVVAANVAGASVAGYPYAASMSGAIDPATGRVHFAFCDGSSSTRSPGYVTGTVAVSGTPANNVITWAAPFAVGSPAASNSSPALGIDRTSRVFLFWATSTSSSSSDVLYATIASPYTSAGTATNLTNGAAGNNNQPHVPRAEVLAGFVPLVFLQGTGNPYKALLDTSIPTG
jgi:hypothetical protein